MNVLPPLYKPTKTGAIQVCSISYEGPIFTVEFGQLNGKMQTKSTECFTTNEGRANERNPEAQAEFEAKAKHAIKVKAGYSTNVEAPTTVQLCQKVKVYQDQLHNVQDEVYTSDKLDGVNGIFRRENTKGYNELVLYSRGGEVYPRIEHLSFDIEHLMDTNNLDELNVELYIEDTPLQDIQSAVKKPKELSQRIEARIFELPTFPGNYEARLAKLLTIDTSMYSQVSVIPVEKVKKEQIEECYNRAIANGAEGLMVRNADGMYIHNQRSSSVFKYKKAKDAEYQIDNYSVDKNGHPVFLCHTEDGKPFKVKPKGTNEERLAIITNIDNYLDHWYKIEYETLSKDGVPQKPVGIGLRNCDAAGQPLE